MRVGRSGRNRRPCFGQQWKEMDRRWRGAQRGKRTFDFRRDRSFCVSGRTRLSWRCGDTGRSRGQKLAPHTQYEQPDTVERQGGKDDQQKRSAHHLSSINPIRTTVHGLLPTFIESVFLHALCSKPSLIVIPLRLLANVLKVLCATALTKLALLCYTVPYRLIKYYI